MGEKAVGFWSPVNSYVYGRVAGELLFKELTEFRKGPSAFDVFTSISLLECFQAFSNLNPISQKPVRSLRFPSHPLYSANGLISII